MFRFNVQAGAFLCAATQVWAATIWDFSDRADSRALQNADRISAYTASVTAQATAPASVTNNNALSAAQLTSISPSGLAGAHRNGRAYRVAYADTARIDMGLTNRAGLNRRHRRHQPAVGTTAIVAAASGVPDSGRTLLMLGGALAMLVSIHALRARALLS